MVSSEEGTFESLAFCLQGTRHNLIEWGHEYLRSLSGEISQVYNKRVEEKANTHDLDGLVDTIIPYFMKHNEEPEAVDLLMEVEQLDKLKRFILVTNYERVCLYLLSCAQYAADPEEMSVAYRTCYEIYLSQGKFPQALRVAQRVNDLDLIKECFDKCEDKVTLYQMSFMCGR